MRLNKLDISVKSFSIVFGLVLFALIITGWFYWFEWRPAEIRELCLIEVKKEIASRENLTVSGANNHYQVCLVKHGMKPESFILKK